MKIEVHRVDDDGRQRPWRVPFRVWAWLIVIAFGLGLAVALVILATVFFGAVAAIAVCGFIIAVYLGGLRRRIANWWHALVARLKGQDPLAKP